MKKRNRRRRKGSRQSVFSTNNRAATQGDRCKRRWPDLSMEELTENRIGSTDKAALAAEYAAVKQIPGCRAGIGDPPPRKHDQNGGD